MAEIEYVILVDELDNVIGKEDRIVARQKALLHQGVGVLVFNECNELLVHKRSEEKQVYPNLYDVIIGGSVNWTESYEQAAQRELTEELGTECTKLQKLFLFNYRSIERNVNFQIFTCKLNGKAILQTGEVKYGMFLSMDQVIELMKTDGFCPYAHRILNEFIKLNQVNAWIEMPVLHR